MEYIQTRMDRQITDKLKERVKEYEGLYENFASRMKMRNVLVNGQIGQIEENFKEIAS